MRQRVGGISENLAPSQADTKASAGPQIYTQRSSQRLYGAIGRTAGMAGFHQTFTLEPRLVRVTE